MNRDIAVLREVINKLTPMLTGMGITVTQRGMQAYVKTDARTLKPIEVNIPYLPDNASENLIVAIHGFIDHEVAHVLFTDWSVVKKAVKGGPNLDALHNIIEDTFIEREIAKKWPGSAYNVGRLREFFVRHITTPALAAATTDVERFGILLVPACRAWAGQKEFIAFMDAGRHWEHPMLKALAKALPKAIKDRMLTARSSQECLDIAIEMHKIIYPPSKAPPSASKEKGDKSEKPSKERSKESSKSTKPDEKGEGEEAASGKETEPEKSDGEEEKSDKKKDKKDKKDKKGKEEKDEEKEKDGEKETKPKSSKGDEEDEEDPSAPSDDAGDAGGDEDDPDEGDEEADGEGSDSAGTEEDDETDGDESGDTGEGDGEREGDAGDDDETAGDGSKSKSGKGSGEEPDADELEMEIGDSPFADPPDLAKSTFEGMIKVKLSDEAAAASASAPYLVYTKDFDRIEPYKVSAYYNESQFATFDDETKHMIGPMQKDIERMMAQRSRSMMVPGFRSGRLHAAGLHRLTVNDDRIFRRKLEAPSKDTAVTLLVDNSGSMSGSKIRTAMSAAYALSQTLERVGIRHEVLGFTTLTHDRYPAGYNMTVIGAEARRIGRDFSRIEPLYIPIFKGVDERLTPQVKTRFADAWSNRHFLVQNVDGESVEIAGLRLLKQPEKRKVLIVLSDGAPAAIAADWRALRDHLKNVVESLTKRGVETIGIGVQSEEVKRFYPKYFILNDVASLPKTVMGELKAILTK